MKSFELNLNLNNFLLYKSKMNSFKISKVRNKWVDINLFCINLNSLNYKVKMKSFELNLNLYNFLIYKSKMKVYIIKGKI